MPGNTTIHRGVCPHNCWDTCGLLVHVRDGRAVKVTGNPEHPVTRGFVCAKMNQYLRRIYSPLRVLHPMKRIGAKGEGRFTRVSWEEALGIITDRLGDMSRKFGPEAILPYSYSGTLGVLNNASMDRRLWNRLGASRLARTICSVAGGEALNLTLGTKMGYDPEAMVRAKLIIVWGLNVLSTNVHQWPILEEARRNGATIVVIDPFRHETARRAHWHLQPRPGTDAALVLGLMNVIISDGLHDSEFISRFGLGFDSLVERAAYYPPEKVAEITGIAADDIRRLARLYATTRPAAIRAGYGLQRHTNGGSIIRAIACLPALVGAWKDDGGGFLLSNGGAYNLNTRALERPDLLRTTPREINMNQLGDALLKADPPIRALFVYNSNPAAVVPDQTQVIKGLRREDLFVVVHEQLMTDTAHYADVVLPATTQFEHLDLHASYWHLYLQLNEPCLAPMGEGKPNTELFRLLARAMEFQEECFQDTDEDLVRQALSSGHPHLAGITLAALRQRGFIKLNVDTPFQPFRDGFPTPSGRVEFYSQTLAERGLDPLPGYVPLAESEDGSPEVFQSYPIHLISPAAHHFLNSSFAHIPELQAREGTPSVFINPEDATLRGIADGDWVRVFNTRGECRLRARVGDWSRPGVAISPSLWWRRQSPGSFNVNATTSQLLADYAGGCTFHTNLVEIERVDSLYTLAQAIGGGDHSEALSTNTEALRFLTTSDRAE